MKTNETEAREMADEGMPVETRRSCRATCGIDRQGEFNVSMKDGIETYGEEYRLDSLRKASEWAIAHLAYEEIGKGW